MMMKKLVVDILLVISSHEWMIIPSPFRSNLCEVKNPSMQNWETGKDAFIFVLVILISPVSTRF